MNVDQVKCPMCGSDDVFLNNSGEGVCDECGYHGKLRGSKESNTENKRSI